MRDVDIFQMALGLTPPWEVESCEFSPEKKRLDIRLTFPRGSVFVCPECGDGGLKAYDTTDHCCLIVSAHGVVADSCAFPVRSCFDLRGFSGKNPV